MTDVVRLLIAVCAITFGCCFVRLGKYALLSQHRFLQFCERARRNGVETDDIDLRSFGEPVSLRLIGLGLLAIGLFIVVSVASFLLISVGHLT